MYVIYNVLIIEDGTDEMKSSSGRWEDEVRVVVGVGLNQVQSRPQTSVWFFRHHRLSDPKTIKY